MTNIITLSNLSDDFIADFEEGEVKVDWTRVPKLRRFYKLDGTEVTTLKETSGVVTTDKDGNWKVDYSFLKLEGVLSVQATGISTGTALADRRFASLAPNFHTSETNLTTCSGILLSSSSVGLLAAMTMVAAQGSLYFHIIGY